MKKIKWIILGVILTPVIYVLAMSSIVPWFWQVTYSGDGEYDISIEGPLLLSYELNFPVFELDENSTRVHKIEHLGTYGSPYFILYLNSDNPIPFVRMDTIVSVILKNSKGEIVYEIESPLSSARALCKMEWEEALEWRENNKLYWGAYGPCHTYETNTALKTKDVFYVMKDTPEFSWWEDYELTINVKPEGKSYGAIYARVGLVRGWK